MSEWASKQVREVLDGGLLAPDTFFRMKVTGRVESKWFNLTPRMLAEIATTLTEPGDGPPCEHPIEDFNLVEDGYQRQWYTQIDEDEKVITAGYGGSEDFGDEGSGTEYLQCGTCLSTRPVPDGYEINWQ